MNYKINFFYKDDKHLGIVIPESEVPNLFDCLNNSQVYRNKDSGAGFWTDIRDIRYITAKEEPIEAGIERIEAEQPRGSAEPLPEGDGDNQAGEEASGEA